MWKQLSIYFYQKSEPCISPRLGQQHISNTSSLPGSEAAPTTHVLILQLTFFFFFLKQTSKTCVWGSISKQAQSSWQSAFLGAIRSNCLFIGINLGLRNLNQDDGLILLYKHIQESKLYCKHSYLTQVKRSPDNLSWRVERGRQSDKPKVTLSLWKMGYKHCLDMLVRPVCASADKFGG